MNDQELLNQIECTLRENMSHRELQQFPELTDHMIAELFRLSKAYAASETRLAVTQVG